MTKNKRFGSVGKGDFTPFHQVHVAMSGEIVNELNMPICNCDLDVNPSKINKGNASNIVTCLNEYDAMQDVVNGVGPFISYLRDFFPDEPVFSGVGGPKAITLKNLEVALEKLVKVRSQPDSQFA